MANPGLSTCPINEFLTIAGPFARFQGSPGPDHIMLAEFRLADECLVEIGGSDAKFERKSEDLIHHPHEVDGV